MGESGGNGVEKFWTGLRDLSGIFPTCMIAYPEAVAGYRGRRLRNVTDRISAEG